MAAVRDVCREMGGTILVRSEPGKGTLFHFMFPTTTLIDDAAQSIFEQRPKDSIDPSYVLPFGRSQMPVPC